MGAKLWCPPMPVRRVVFKLMSELFAKRAIFKKWEPVFIEKNCPKKTAKQRQNVMEREEERNCTVDTKGSMYKKLPCGYLKADLQLLVKCKYFWSKQAIYFTKAPFMQAPPFGGLCLLSGGSLHSSPLSRRPPLIAQSGDGYSPTLFYGEIGCKQTACPFSLNPIWSARWMGNRDQIG